MDTINWINRLHQTVLKENGLNKEIKEINENISKLMTNRASLFKELKANQCERNYLISLRPEVI